MRITALQQNSVIRYLITPTLVLWMVGLLCLFCCTVEKEKLTTSSHSCCQSQDSKNSCGVNATKTPAPSHNEDKNKRCCLLTSSPATLTSTSYSIDYVAAEVPPQWGMAILASFSINREALYSRSPVDQTETYLRCCVLLI